MAEILKGGKKEGVMKAEDFRWREECVKGARVGVCKVCLDHTADLPWQGPGASQEGQGKGGGSQSTTSLEEERERQSSVR